MEQIYVKLLYFFFILHFPFEITPVITFCHFYCKISFYHGSIKLVDLRIVFTGCVASLINSFSCVKLAAWPFKAWLSRPILISGEAILRRKRDWERDEKRCRGTFISVEEWRLILLSGMGGNVRHTSAPIYLMPILSLFLALLYFT